MNCPHSYVSPVFCPDCNRASTEPTILTANVRRSQRAEDTLKAYANLADDPYDCQDTGTWVTDLLSDLAHLVGPADMTEYLRVALQHHEEEA